MKKHHLFTTYLSYLRSRIKRNEKAFRVYTILRVLVIITLIRSILTLNLESAALCILSLLLFLIPTFMEENAHVEVPAAMQITIYLFIYAAEILGEINRFYTIIPGWDTMLHTINGFLCAAIGYSMVDIVNRGSKRVSLSPFYLSMMALCFSMTICVCWEFIEFTIDKFFYLDMQKDYIIRNIGSVTLDPTHSQIPVRISGISKTVIHTKAGKIYTLDGYLDIGLIDTMKDLMVGFAGAFIFSVLGYIYCKFGKPKHFTEDLLVTATDDRGGKERIDEFAKAQKLNRQVRMDKAVQEMNEVFEKRMDWYNKEQENGQSTSWNVEKMMDIHGNKDLPKGKNDGKTKKSGGRGESTGQ